MVNNTSHTSSGHTIPLSQLARGQKGVLKTCDLPECDGKILAAMGLTDACELSVCRRGEPCIIRVNATRLGLSASLAERLHVHVVPPPVAAV